MGNTLLRVLSLSTQIMFTVLLSLCIGYAAGQTCQQAGSMCYRVTSSPVGLVGGSCCDSCRPYLPNGATAWTGTTDWYCMYTSGGTEGQSCSDYTGGCAAGLTCTNSVCTSSSSTDSPTSATSNTDTTASGATSASTSAASTTAACQANGGDVCVDTNYGISKTCCSPYNCVSVTSRTSICTASELQAGEACYSNGVSVGTCASGLICLDGVCKTASTDCADPVYPDGLCYSADVGRTVATCCGATYCMKPTDNADSFCMDFAIAENLPCGDTQAEGYRGYCASGLNCLNGVCSSALTTTTTTTTTVTAETTTIVCKGPGDACWEGPGTQPDTCCGASCDIGSRTCV